MPTSENAANAAKKSKPMSKKLLQHFEKRLMEERRRAVKSPFNAPLQASLATCGTSCASMNSGNTDRNCAAASAAPS